MEPNRGLLREVILPIMLLVAVVTLVFTINHTNDLLEKDAERQEQVDKDADVDRLRAEYQRILLGCHTAGAVESQDEQLRELCDVTLQRVREQLQEAL